MVDVAVTSGASWVCHAAGRPLVDVVLPVHISNNEDIGQMEGDKTNSGSPALLQQTQEGSPCVLTLHCTPTSPCAISRLLVISEARTIEVYDHTGEYCGTVRGERDDTVHTDRDDRGPFYRKQLTLESPASSCEVKLLSLAGRSSVLVSRVVVGLRPQQRCPARGPGIDMQQVQSLVEELGTNLSPGAQNLMEMVHFQQKNQTSSLGGFLPLLMGSGAFSALAGKNNMFLEAVSSQPQPGESKPLAETIRPADETPPHQNGAEGSGLCPSDLPQSHVHTTNTESKRPVSHAQLAKMVSHLLAVEGHGPALGSSPELLPVLQSLCGQVTQLRLEDAAEKEKIKNGTWELDSAMERRLEEMERRLKEHVDRRLDALEQKLEQALLGALPLLALSPGAASPVGAERPDASRAPSSEP